MNEIVAMDSAQARALTDRIKVAVGATWEMIAEAYQSRAWAALGYASWDDYTTREFGTSRLRLPREERQEVVASLRDSGLSIRAIAAVTGDAVGTVHAELSGVQIRTPEPRPLVDTDTGEISDIDELMLEDSQPAPAPLHEPQRVTGTDGKSYPVPQRQAVERRPDLTAASRALATDLFRMTNRIQKLAEDDRLGRNAEQVAAHLRNHLSDAIEVCQDLLDRLPALTSEVTA